MQVDKGSVIEVVLLKLLVIESKQDTISRLLSIFFIQVVVPVCYYSMINLYCFHIT